MLVQLCVVSLVLCSLTAASDPECEKLLEPLNDRSQIAGKWIFYAGTADNSKVLDELRTINSSWIDMEFSSNGSNMALSWGNNVNGTCHHGNVKNISFGDSIDVIFQHNATTEVHIGRHLVTCPDCILYTDTVTDSNKEDKNSRTLFLFTKSGNLNATHFEVFKKQVECLNFQPDFHFGDTTDFCLYATEGKEH